VYDEFPKTLKVDFYDADGKIESHLDAKYGKYFETFNKVYLRDSVLIFNMQGDTLQTPELWWDQNSQRLYTDKRVRVRKSGNLIFGVGMEAKQDLSDINIKQVTGTLLVPDSLAGQ
jgi:LPS export ABC transporter protein LptC